VNSKLLSYHNGSPERNEVIKVIKDMRSKVIDIPLIIGGKEVRTGSTAKVVVPHEHSKVLANYHKARKEDVMKAIEEANKAWKEWSNTSLEHRIAVILKIGELLETKYRQIINASTILGQSKNFFQAEIDAAAECVDFCRFNSSMAQFINSIQPISPSDAWNRMQYRPLEGFVYAVTPFNFTSIALNLCLSPVLMGNVAIWKPSSTAIYSAYHLMQLYKEAGLPDGVINFIPGQAGMITDILLNDPNFAGLHYTGSTEVFNSLWEKISKNLSIYKNYPRIVGETGGKDFIFAHNSANIPALVTALIRGAFEYAGQKCSAASRGYIPKSIWNKVKERLINDLKEVKYGNPEDPSVLVNAVINEESFNNTVRYIELAKSSKDCEIIFGGSYDKSVGYFIQPTVVVTTNPHHRLIKEEIFAPVLTLYIYDDDKFEETLTLCDKGSPYALTGSFFAQDRYAIVKGEQALTYTAGNFYINDKPTGAVVAQQPFGGGRASGTNDKAGSVLNLLRWTSVRTIKENFIPPTHWKYPYMS